MVFGAQVHILTELFFAYFIVTGLTVGMLYAAQIFDSLPSRCQLTSPTTSRSGHNENVLRYSIEILGCCHWEHCG